MKQKLILFFRKAIDWQQKQYNLLIKGKDDKLPYTSLSPIGNADIGNDYKKSLDWALKNRKEFDIKNIALTGPYGSGKSSILKTYIKNYKARDLEFLNISLATFKEEEASSNTNTEKADLLRLIELSILQQIFYYEEDRKIPDSRFRKIKNYTRQNLLMTTFGLFFLLISAVNLIYPKLFGNLLQVNFDATFLIVSRYISLLIITIAVIVILFKSIRTINSIKFNKLNIQNAEIGVGDQLNKSILNHHLDEILYFFEVTPYNVVIIEDLDRFKQTEIFTKLREINLLLNNSKKIKKEVVFIYAVRDDMFKEENERTKFFDFIIPVIPVINPSNSGEKLLEQKRTNNYDISENLIDSISLFVDDMRLLYNIMNEYYLYQQKLNKSLSQDKLLAMIVYKNIFPNDFTELSNNKGILFGAINSKQTYINQEILKRDDEINKFKEEIKQLENLKIKDIKELRYMYLLFYLPSLSGFISFHIDEVDVTLANMASDKNFDYLITNKAKYRSSSYYPQIQNIPAQFSQIEKQVDSVKTYSDRKKQIEDWNNNQVEVLKKEIQKLENVKSQLKNFKVRKLLGQGQVELDIVDSKQKKLVGVLLRNGFIDENYLDYVSIFYEGSITKNDHQFLINVKSQVATDFTHKLYNVDKVIAKINLLEFDKEYTLNYDLLNFVLENSNYKAVRDAVFTKLNDESDISLKFIDGFIGAGKNVGIFINELTRRWISIWSFLENKSNFPQETKDVYFKLIIEHAEIGDIKKLYENVFFKSSLLQKPHFLNVIPDVERLKAIVKTLSVKFVDLDISETPTELLDYVYDGNFYKINEKMIKSILKARDKLNEKDFDTKNYFAIANADCHNLKNYIDDNINEYVENVYLKLTSNTEEDQDCLTDLLNDDQILIENKSKIIKQQKTVVEDLSSVSDLEVSKILLENSKVFPAWKNVFNYYERDEENISAPIITFLESPGVAAQISKSKIPKDVKDESKYTGFISRLITTDTLQNHTYETILKSVPYTFTSLTLSSLSKPKVELLIKNDILAFNKNNYDSIKGSYGDLHVYFIEANKDKFLSSVNDFDLNASDFFKILKSATLSSEEKNKVLETIDENLISADSNSLKAIGELILKYNGFRVSDALIKLIIINQKLTLEQRIRLHNWKHKQIEINYYDTFLSSLEEPYSDITILGKRPLLKDTEYNRKMVEILDSKNYISKYDVDEKGIRISTFRKESDERTRFLG